MLFILPVSILVLIASWVASAGLAATWSTATTHRALFAAVSLALHAIWVLPVARERSPFAGAIAWILSVYFCREGLLVGDSGGLPTALLLEAIPLLVALPPRTWPDRAARWRRSQLDVTAQLNLGPGIVPWARDAFHSILRGPKTADGAPDEASLAVLAELDRRASGCEALLNNLAEKTGGPRA
jgi:hypothetical protein